MSFFDRLFRRHAVADGTIRDTATRVFVKGYLVHRHAVEDGTTRDTATRVFINDTEFRAGIDAIPTGAHVLIGDGLHVGGGFIVIGNGCTVHGDGSHVIGNNAIVKGSHCIVDGDGCIVTGDDCIVYGKGCRNSGRRSVVYAYARSRKNIYLGPEVPDCNSPATCVFVSDIYTFHGARCPRDVHRALGSANATAFDVDHEDVKVDDDTHARDQVCVVCLSNARSIAAIPCLHVALCHECCAGLKASGARDLATGLHLCTQCRRGVERFGHIYN